MKVDKHYKRSVILLILYEVLILLINPENGSVLKIGISIFLIGSFASLIAYFIQNKKAIQFNFKRTFFLLILLVLYGVINTIRSFELNTQVLVTLLGNKNTGLAMVLPLAFVSGLNVANIIWFNKISVNMLRIGLLLLPLSLLNGIFLDYSVYFLLFYIIPFILFFYQSNANKRIVLCATIVLFVSAIFLSGRFNALQILFITTCHIAYFIYDKVRIRYLRNLFIIAIIAFPFVIMLSGFQIFEYFSSMSDVEIGATNTVDTRSFIYNEVPADLEKNNAIVFGKGALGKYYSPYFAQGFQNADNENRLNVEVGILSMMLKGGLVNVLLNLSLLLFALIASFKSRNKFTQRLSILVLCHFLSVFIADIPQYSMVNYSYWIVIGTCISLMVSQTAEKDVILAFRSAELKKPNRKRIKISTITNRHMNLHGRNH